MMEVAAKRMENIGSDIRGKNFWAALDLEKQGQKVLKLNTGNPAAFGFKTPESVREALIKNLDRALGYSDVRGMIDAREAIFAYHKGKGVENFGMDDIFIGNGVSEIASMIATALFDKGDEILVPSPCYSLWSNEILLSDAVPVYYTCDESNHWNPDIDHIKSLITPKTKAILLINPNNPTGVLYSNEILLEIAEIARQNDMMILSDEIYDRLVFDGLEHTAMAKLAPDLTVLTMNGLSKSHCLCGYRCGWVVVSGPEAVRSEINAAMLKVASIRLGANSIMQTTIPAALADTEYSKSMIMPGGRLYEQRKATCEELDKIDGVSYVKNDGSLYVFPKIEKGVIENDKQFAYDLLMDKHVLIVPGSGFKWPTHDHFRIVMLPEADILRKAVSEIGDFITKTL
ncbi:MAG: aminotransferase class I/II-fold pyridoxal phosphate-dependent enzyme [Ruminococcaceae bacterium]|nr:aminotransferase class I/II-fold pyridoxal phosphate-dependent enzyme [Oscillospiraceae bacterium]